MFFHNKRKCHIVDEGENSLVVNMKRTAECNNAYRAALWTGKYLQAALMQINILDDIGLENHPESDQFIMVSSGIGIVSLGDRRDKMTIHQKVKSGDGIFIPAGKWHNISNIGKKPLKLISFYAPPHHPKGTNQPRKKDAKKS